MKSIRTIEDLGPEAQWIAGRFNLEIENILPDCVKFLETIESSKGVIRFDSGQLNMGDSAMSEVAGCVVVCMELMYNDAIQLPYPTNGLSTEMAKLFLETDGAITRVDPLDNYRLLTAYFLGVMIIHQCHCCIGYAS